MRIEIEELKKTRTTKGGDDDEGKREQIDLEMELCQAQLACNALREQLAQHTAHAGGDDAATQCVTLREELAKEMEARISVEEELALEQEESHRLREEMEEEKESHRQAKKEIKRMRREVGEAEKVEKIDEEERKEPTTTTTKYSAGDYEVIKEECATLRGECRVLREDRNTWREECNKAKEDSKRWRDQCSEVEIEFREVRIVHEESIHLITALRRDNELMRRDNELLWEQLDVWGVLGHGYGLKGEERSKGGEKWSNNNTNDSGVSEPRKDDSGRRTTNDERVEVNPSSTNATLDTQDSQDTQRTQDTQDTQDTQRTTADANGLDESHRSSASAPAGRMNPAPSPIPPLSSSSSSQPRLFPQPNADDSFESSVDTQSIMFEAQALAHQRSASMILAQMEKLGGQLHTLIHAARQANAAQWGNHQTHAAHLHAQLSRMRDTTLRLRDVYDHDSQRIQEASLDALRSHLNGIKSVYNALSY